MAQDAFQQLAQREEMVEGLLAGSELDQDIHVAIATCLVPLHRAKERQALHPQPENLRAGGGDASFNVGAIQD